MLNYTSYDPPINQHEPYGTDRAGCVQSIRSCCQLATRASSLRSESANVVDVLNIEACPARDMSALRVARQPPLGIRVVLGEALFEALAFLLIGVDRCQVLHFISREVFGLVDPKMLTPMNAARGWPYSLLCSFSGVWRVYVADPCAASMFFVMSEIGNWMNVSAPSGWHGASDIS